MKIKYINVTLSSVQFLTYKTSLDIKNTFVPFCRTALWIHEHFIRHLMTVHSVPDTLCKVGAQAGHWGWGHENEYKCKHSQKKHFESFSILCNLNLFLFKYEKNFFNLFGRWGQVFCYQISQIIFSFVLATIFFHSWCHCTPHGFLMVSHLR